MRSEEITLETIQVERPDKHPDLATYQTVTFRILPADHPNSFIVPVSVNLDQYGPGEVEDQARRIFHGLMTALGKATSGWATGSDAADAGDTPNLSDARLGPAGDPAEGKRDLAE